MSRSSGPRPDEPRRGDRRRIAAVALFFLLYTLAVTWPGFLPFNRIRPLVLGLPFSMVWVAGWVLAGGVVLFWLDRDS